MQGAFAAVSLRRFEKSVVTSTRKTSCLVHRTLISYTETVAPDSLQLLCRSKWGLLAVVMGGGEAAGLAD